MRRLVGVLMLVCLGVAGAAAPAGPADAAPDQAPDRRPVLLVGGTFTAQRALDEFVKPWLLGAGYAEAEVASVELARWDELPMWVEDIIRSYGEQYGTHASGAGTARMGSLRDGSGGPPPLEPDTSAFRVAEAVDTLLARTGADQVDIIGHSQGAAVVRHYVKFYGQDKVGTMISLGGVNWGITREITGDWFWDLVSRLLCVAPVCDQIFYERLPDGGLELPQFFIELNSGDPTPGDVAYYHLYTWTEEGDREPWRRGETLLLPDATNVSAQEVCGDDYPVYHVDEFEHPAMQDMMLAALEGREITSRCQADWEPRRCEVEGAPDCEEYAAVRRVAGRTS